MIAAAWILSAAALFAQEYGVVNISVCNMRRTADFDAEMVSQALLGTPVRILDWSAGSARRWPRIQTPDDYTGWVHYAVVVPMTHEQLHAWNAAPKVVVTALNGIVYEEASTRSATVSDVVGGDRLKYLGRKGFWLQVEFPDGRRGYVSEEVAREERCWRKHLDQSPEAILATAKSMLGFPYIWAGMSPKGTDCSGFVRAVLFMHDIIIPRDCNQMYPKGQLVKDPSDLQPGDLLYFGRWREDGTGSASHVAFYLGEGRFIHSLGLVQIASLRKEDPLYDAFNAGRFLCGGRILPFIDKEEGLNTTLTNPYYAE
jgi:hypothetical protein